jgi:hypothetical protein
MSEVVAWKFPKNDFAKLNCNFNLNTFESINSLNMQKFMNSLHLRVRVNLGVWPAACHFLRQGGPSVLAKLEA